MQHWIFNSSITWRHPGRSFLTSFSQKWTGIQPIEISNWSLRLSLSIFSSIFSIQYSRFRCKRSFRVIQSLPCQNSPSIKIAKWYFRIAMSGEPGKRLSFLRYRYPKCHKCFASSCSVSPFLSFTLDMRFRVSGVDSYDLGCFITVHYIKRSAWCFYPHKNFLAPQVR